MSFFLVAAGEYNNILWFFGVATLTVATEKCGFFYVSGKNDAKQKFLQQLR